MTGATNESAGGTGKQVAVRETHRQYTIDFKRRLVEETFAPGQSVSIVARRHDINSNLVFSWRKKYRDGTLRGSKPASRATTSPGQDLIRVGVLDAGSGLRPVLAVSDSSAPSPPLRENSTGVAGIIEIELPNRVKVRVAADIGEAALRRVLAVARQQA